MRIEHTDRRETIVLFSNTLWYLFTFRRRTIEVLQAQGLHVVCVGQCDNTLPKLQRLGCTVRPLDWKLSCMNPFHELRIAWSVIQTLRQYRPIAVFAFTIKANLNASIACRLCRVPYVVNVSGLGTAFLHDSVRHRLIRQLYGFANASAHTVFFQNRADREQLAASGLSTGRRSKILPGSGVDTERFTFVAPRKQVRTFVMIARLIRDKGIIEYLESARRFKAEWPELRFLLVGPCKVENLSAVALVEVEAYADSVEYWGELEDVRPALVEADCIVLPSYREGMPKVVLEAASMGRIAVVTDVPGCRDAIVPDDTGFLCAHHSVDDLVRAMRQAAELKVTTIERMSRAARDRAVQIFSERQSIQPYLEILDELRPGLPSAHPHVTAGVELST